MVNQVALIGKIISFDKQGNNYSIWLEVERPTKDEHGRITSMQICCVAWRGVAESVQRYYKVGDVIAVGGRLDISHDTTLHVIAETTHILYRGQLKKEVLLEQQE